MMAGHNSF